jgi:hypothetical protein
MGNAEAQVCRAAGPRWEARWGAGGAAVGEVCFPKDSRLFMATSAKAESPLLSLVR